MYQLVGHPLVASYAGLGLVVRGGLEPPASALSGRRSNQMSYRTKQQGRSAPALPRAGALRPCCGLTVVKGTPPLADLIGGLTLGATARWSG